MPIYIEVCVCVCVCVYLCIICGADKFAADAVLELFDLRDDATWQTGDVVRGRARARAP
jgi:hypothetical protein